MQEPIQEPNQEPIKDNKGITKPAVIALIVIVLLVAAGVVIWQLAQKSSPGGSASITSTPSPIAVSSSCQKSFNDNTLCAFAEHLKLSAMAYVATGTATNADGASSTFTIKNDGQGNKELTYTKGSEQISAVTLNGVTYLQEGADTTWLQYPTGNAPAAADPVSGFNLNLDTASTAGLTVTKERTSACGNLTCYGYKVIDASDPGGTAYIYFDNHSYLLRHWTSHNTRTGISVDLAFSYPTVTIAKPSPVQ
jgi:hypothetical protein